MPALYELTSADLADVLAIQSVCYQPFFHESAASFLAKLKASPDTHWLCRRDGQALGYLMTLPVQSGRLPALNAGQLAPAIAADWLYVHDMAVLPAARSLGLGGHFMAEAERAAQRKGLRGLVLVAVQNAESYWVKLGFQRKVGISEALAEKLVGFGEGAVYMEKVLAGTDGSDVAGNKKSPIC